MSTILLLSALSAVPGANVGDIVVHAHGNLQLTCNSQWHILNLSLSPKATFRLSEIGRAMLRPRILKDGATWKLEGKKIDPLAKALHNVQWVAAARDEEAYQKWLGQMVVKEDRASEGSLSIRLVKEKNGFRGVISGVIQTKDTGYLASRFGPNWWEKNWSHKVEGSARYNKEGRLVSLEMKSTFKTEGLYSNLGGKLPEPFKQKGTVELLFKAPKPLSKEQALRVEKLIAQLGATRFTDREKANQELLRMGRSIVPLLREVGLASEDREVLLRVRKILAQLK